MAHNRDEEKEHAAMTLEWLRRNDAKWDEVLRTYLFTDLPIIEVEHEAEAAEAAARRHPPDRSSIGDLQKGTPAMNHLLRELAPVPSAAWEQIDEEATRTLRHFLTACRLVDIDGPARVDQGVRHAWARRRRERRAGRASRDGCARCSRCSSTAPSSGWSAAELDAIDRGALDADLDPARDAARRLALAEDGAVFQGHRGGLIDGIADASPHEKIPISDDYRDYPNAVARAVAMLQTSGVAGPYSVALGPRCYTGVVETTEMGGYPVLEHLRLISGGPVLWAPGVDGAVVLSTRGGDFQLTRRRGRLDRLPRPRRDVGAPLPRGVLHLHGAHPRGGGAPRGTASAYGGLCPTKRTGYRPASADPEVAGSVVDLSGSGTATTSGREDAVALVVVATTRDRHDDAVRVDEADACLVAIVRHEHLSGGVHVHVTDATELRGGRRAPVARETLHAVAGDHRACPAGGDREDLPPRTTVEDLCRAEDRPGRLVDREVIATEIHGARDRNRRRGTRHLVDAITERTTWVRDHIPRAEEQPPVGCVRHRGPIARSNVNTVSESPVSGSSATVIV